MEEQKPKKNSKGRPSKAEKVKNKLLTSRFTEQEYQELELKAQNAGMKITQLGREFILKGHVTNLFTKEEQEELRHLKGVANNLNQLVKNLNYFSKNYNEKEVSNQLTKSEACIDAMYNILKKYHK